MTRTKPRSGSTLRSTVGTVLVLLLIAVGVDQGARLITQSAAANRFQSSQHLPSKPSIHVMGFPFLTQLARRRFDHVRVTANGLVLAQSSSSLRIASLTADLYGLTVASDLSSAVTRSGTGSALISYPDLSRYAGVTVSYAGAGQGGRGRVQAGKTISVLGQSISGTIAAVPAVSGQNEISFNDPQVNVGGAAVPQAITDQFNGLLPPLSLRRLPNGLVVREVAAQPDGVLVTLVANDVTVRQP